jgi:hypothetical protein
MQKTGTKCAGLKGLPIAKMRCVGPVSHFLLFVCKLQFVCMLLFVRKLLFVCMSLFA